MKGRIGLLLGLAGLLTLSACGGSVQNPSASSTPVTSREARTDSGAAAYIQIQDPEGRTVIYQLNDSPGARALYQQLPLSIDVESFGDNEKIFYPPAGLDTADTPLAEGGAGKLAYYAPWGDVVMFYGDFRTSGDLYALGVAVSGEADIPALSGRIRVEAAIGAQGASAALSEAGRPQENPPPEKTGTGSALLSQTAPSQPSSRTSTAASVSSEVRTSGPETVFEEETSAAAASGMPAAEVPAASEPSATTQPDTPAENGNAMLRMEIAVGDRVFAGRLYDNEAGRALLARMPMTLDMRELNGNEKFFYLPEGLPAKASRPSGIRAGDFMLYGTDCLVLFYDSFSTSYSYTPLGRLDNAAELAAALGHGNVRVTFRKNISCAV